MVRVWTTCTLREHWADCETGPSMNTHRSAEWGAEEPPLVLLVGVNRPRLKKQSLVVQVGRKEEGGRRKDNESEK